jgi:hypothetical protein
LWYLEKGVAFANTRWITRPPFAVAGNLRLDSIEIVQPGTLEQFGRRVYAQLESPAEQIALLGDVWPWPASLTEITFTSSFK